MSKGQQLELSLSTGPYEFTRCGLAVNGDSTKEQWETCGEGLRAVEEARQWAIGDWLRDGKTHYGDRLYERAAAITKISEGELRQFKSLSERFELLGRTNNLSWRHHYEVASLKLTAENEDGTLKASDEPDTGLMQELLAQAAKDSWSVKELRAEVLKAKEAQREHIRLANEPEKYEVIYADPPWEYTSGDQHTDEAQHTVLGTHYPSMSLGDICGLPVEKMASSDAVLFMWCTSPTLEEAFDVVRSWGFEYKASMIWDKVGHNVGNYVSVRHEILLICKRGQPPKVPKLVDSVYVEERTRHSSKPDYFRELIDELYPKGKRIEMFARQESDGWEVWGNEVEFV